MSIEASPKGGVGAPPDSMTNPPPTGERFIWRGNPEQTYSDWTIEIVATAKYDDARGESNGGELIEETVTTYHVHKALLASGTTKSEYFANLFRSRFNESKSCLSRIELDPLAASAFPALLDYIYAKDGYLDINSNNATALHYLGEYFDTKPLRRDALQFCVKDMSLENLHIYYQHATLFQNESILGILAEFANKSLLDVSPSAAIIKQAEPKFWVKMLKALPIETSKLSKRSLHWSKLIPEIGTLHGEAIDKDTFDKLTNITVLPTVHHEAALSLCELDDILHAYNNGENELKQENDPDPNCLQKRCAAALSQNWRKLAVLEDEVKLLEHRKPVFLAHLLLQSLSLAKKSLSLRR